MPLSNKHNKAMKKQFNINEWMTENRDVVIAKYNALKDEKFFSGITMKAFGVAVLEGVRNNSPRNEKRAAMVLSMVMSSIYSDNTSFGVGYSTPYSESNHAKQVNYFGSAKTAQLNNI